MKRNVKGNLLLLLTAMLWGVSFVMQDKAGEILPPFTINGIRSLIGTAFLVPVSAFFSKKEGRQFFETDKKKKHDLIFAGIICGICLCIATNLQQFGISAYPPDAASSGRTGFITALYVVLVPIAGIFRKKRTTPMLWAGAVLSTVGLFLLCFGGKHGIYFGDLIVFLCAAAFTVQILCVDSFIARVDGIKLSAIQFLVCGVISLILMLFFEKPLFTDILRAVPYILYLGVVSCGIAYTLQIIGQKYAESPTVAAILMSTEALFATISGAVFLGERFSAREAIGCAVMFLAIILAQLPPIKKKKGEN